MMTAEAEDRVVALRDVAKVERAAALDPRVKPEDDGGRGGRREEGLAAKGPRRLAARAR